ncbi:hypothetical protein [Phormidium nigroviride]
MPENYTQQLNAIVKDLDSLITEIENNPRLSTWVGEHPDFAKTKY